MPETSRRGINKTSGSNSRGTGIIRNGPCHSEGVWVLVYNAGCDGIRHGAHAGSEIGASFAEGDGQSARLGGGSRDGTGRVFGEGGGRTGRTLWSAGGP